MMRNVRTARACFCFAMLSSAFVANASAQTSCQYNDRTYSSGASVCECPTFSAQKVGGNYRNGRITSRRLICKDSAWEQTSGLCFDLRLGNSNDFSDAMNTLSQDLCPPAVGSASSY